MLECFGVIDVYGLVFVFYVDENVFCCESSMVSMLL